MNSQQPATPATTAPKRSEKEGIFHFTKEMISALGMALIAIVYVIQAFKIPSESMQDSLLVGDFLLGIKFVYGAPVVPFTYLKFPGIQKPKPGDVIIFEFPGCEAKDYIKRCVAGPGQTIAINGMDVIIDGKKLNLPPKGKYMLNGYTPYPTIANFAPLRIPVKGDIIKTDSLPVREFFYLKNLIVQENPDNRFGRFLRGAPVLGSIFGQGRPKASDHVRMSLQLYVNGEFASDRTFNIPDNSGKTMQISFDQINAYNRLNLLGDWVQLDYSINQITELAKNGFPDKQIEIRKVIYLDNKLLTNYTVKNNNYFMMGDNRDNSADSRYWGYLNYNFIKAKAFILYFSVNKDVPMWQLPLKIRWNRIGKLIRSWDGQTMGAVDAKAMKW